ncbi:MAG: helix-turn-helix domain-containing protein [Chloroflexi bacterium]|uniref:Helix-turn-helix domain-containing protein n=1 Tax=Candidatus Chlorohelix allophototropha TaxID=3003348 RepID=A0A8T7M5U7_9CHLR|nr:helix-turn-helix domain-containing protein [Chloroflexota bacterium]WJW69328.1 helix-turn-helix domain-containing protein [Chloroflexota bacterium L227-S17]
MPSTQLSSTHSEQFSYSLHESEQFVQVPLDVLKADISPAALKLYMVMLSFARQSVSCWASHRRLAEEMGLQPRRVIDLIKELEAAALISVESRAREGQTNIYRLQRRASKPKTTQSYAKSCEGTTQGKTHDSLQDSASNIHESKLHELNTTTPVALDVTDKKIDHSSEISVDSENQSQREICSLLLQCGITTHSAKKLAKIAFQNKRSAKEIEELIQTVRGNERVESIPAYVSRLVEINCLNLGAFNRANTHLSPNRNSSSGLHSGNIKHEKPTDFSKYAPGGKYWYLVASRAN